MPTITDRDVIHFVEETLAESDNAPSSRTATRRRATEDDMSVLPDAVPQHPACGVCGSETSSDGGDYFYCEDCQLSFNSDDFSASFLDDQAKPCCAPCDNYWHGDDKIKPGTGYDCGSCKLPTGHTSLHWTGCQPKTL
jgi:hypothetical protein